MSSSELELPYVEFDYTEDTVVPSSTREGILYAVRLQKVFDQIGTLDVSSEVASYFREPNLRSKLEEIVREKTRVDLSSSELPFLMRVELADAYFQFKIGEHLEQLPYIEISLKGWLSDIVKEPIGKETIERLKRNNEELDEGLVEQVQSRLRARMDFDLYDMIFDGEFKDSPDISAVLASHAAESMPNAIVPHSSSQLASSHFGSNAAIGATLFFNAMSDGYASPKDKAIYRDFMRRLFRQDGEPPEVGPYNVVKLDVEKYRALEPIHRRIIHRFLIENLMDAQKIREVVALFPGKIDQELATRCIIHGLLDAGNIGIKPANEEVDGEYIFDMDPSKPLDRIAMGAQYLLEQYSSIAGKSLVPYGQQSASDRRRDRSNIGMRFLMGDDFSLEGDLDEMTATTFFEHFGIGRPDHQAEYFKAYQRLFGPTGYIGRGDDWWEKFKLELKADGSLVAGYIVHDEEENHHFDPFKEAKHPERGDYFRRAKFDHALDRLKKSLDDEIYGHHRVTHALSVETDGTSPVRVDKWLYLHLTHIREAVDQVAEWNERVVALLPFVNRDYESHLSILGIDSLRGEGQVKEAYRKTIMRDNAHPDLTQDVNEKIQRATRLGELMTARDELLCKLTLGRSAPSTVSYYLGNVSRMLTTE